MTGDTERGFLRVWCCRPHSDQVARYQGPSLCYSDWRYASTTIWELGAVWAGGSDDYLQRLDAAIIFAQWIASASCPQSCQRRRCGLRWHPHERHSLISLRNALGRKVLRSVANLTRKDGEEFLALAPKIPIREVESFPLTAANEALDALRSGKINSAAVIVNYE